MRRLALAALAALAACPSTEAPVHLDLHRDDAGSLALSVVDNLPDSGMPPDAAENRLVRSAPSRTRDVGLCSPDHWCWENPLPQGDDLRAVWVSVEGEVFAVGPAGVALRFDGTTWTRTATATPVDLTAVWGLARGDVWALGPKLGLHWDGKTWKPEPPPPGAPDLLWGADGRLWAAGDAISEWDPKQQAWREVQPGGEWRFVDLSGTSANDLWALARDESPKTRGRGLLFRFDGKAWRRSVLPFALRAGRVVPLGPGAAWLATDQGVLARFDGKSWKQETNLGPGSVPLLMPQPDGGLVAVGPGRPTTRLLAKAWVTEHKPSPALRGLCVSGKDAAWAVGDRGLIARWTGEKWERAFGATDADLRAVHGTALDNLWAVGDGGAILRRADNGEWWRVARPEKSRLRGVWVAGPVDVWVVGDSELAHWDGKGFTSFWDPSHGPLHAVDGRAPGDVWAVGDEGVLHWDGKAWARVPTPATYPLRAVTVTRDGAVWALGEGGMVRRDGETWTEVGASSEHVPTLLFGGSAGPFVAGAKGVWRHDKAWARVLTGDGVTSGYAAAPEDVWAAGPVDEVRVWNGVGWRKTSTGARSTLRAVWAKNGEAIAVGDGGAVLHFRP